MRNTFSFSTLAASEQAFVSAVCASLKANCDEAQLVVLGDGSESPNGERFAAKRLGYSWEVVFNFPETQTAYDTSVQLPRDWRLAA